MTERLNAQGYADGGYTYAYPRPGFSVEVVVLAGRGAEARVLLGKRGREPELGKWALLGGHVEAGESASVAVARELREEAHLEVRPEQLTQLHAFTDPERVDGNWVIGVAHLLQLERVVPTTPGDDVAELRWFALDKVPKLAFDHSEMFEYALRSLRFP